MHKIHDTIIIMLLICIAPLLILVITPNGSPIEGQTYSLTCDLMGDESLNVTERFRWDKLTPAPPKCSIIYAATLSFTPLTVANAGDYMCTNNITSQYLTSIITETQVATVEVLGMNLSISWRSERSEWSHIHKLCCWKSSYFVYGRISIVYYVR